MVRQGYAGKEFGHNMNIGSYNDFHLICAFINDPTFTDMRRLTTGIRSEKSVVGRFRHFANVYLHKPR
jgi:hypothetical protein